MDDMKIVERIAKLLALGSSPNEHEAAMAVAKAQALMLEHNIAMASVESTTVGMRQSIVEEGVFATTKVPIWKKALLSHIADTSFCSFYLSLDLVSVKSNGTNVYQRTVKLVGRPADVEMASYTYSFLERELDRLMAIFLRTVRSYGERGAVKRQRESWYLGAVTGVGTVLRVEFAKRTQQGEAFALVRTSDAERDEYLATKNLKKAAKTHKRLVDGAAYGSGLATGKDVRVAPGTKAGTTNGEPLRLGR